jgi:hypothetical protein
LSVDGSTAFFLVAEATLDADVPFFSGVETGSMERLPFEST